MAGSFKKNLRFRSKWLIQRKSNIAGIQWECKNWMGWVALFFFSFNKKQLFLKHSQHTCSHKDYSKSALFFFF